MLLDWHAHQLPLYPETLAPLKPVLRRVQVIPRGSNALVSSIKQNTKIPVMGHADGICHIYIDQDADVDLACKIVVDAKTDYPAACNAVEKVLVHRKLIGQIYKIQVHSPLTQRKSRGLCLLMKKIRRWTLQC